MAEFTKEQLIASAKLKINSLRGAVTQSAFTEIRRGLEINLLLTEIALAALTSEPVVYRNKDTGSVCNANWLGNHSPDSLGFEPLYRLPEVK